MIALIRGAVAAAGSGWLVVEVGGIGLKVLCTPATALSAQLGDTIALYTSLVVREDSLTLYGFNEAAERDEFEIVQSASGIGPRIASAVVSVLSPDELRVAIVSENIATLTKVPGIGPKGARKLVIELKDKVATLGSGGTAVPHVAKPTEAPWRAQVQAGLESLGWSSKDAEAAVESVDPLYAENPELSVGELLKAALRGLAR